MKITVYSRGMTVINADPGYQEAPIRMVLAKVAAGESHPEWIAENILIAVDADKSNISYDVYAVVTEDDGTVLWRGWLTGDPGAPAPVLLGRDDILAAIDGQAPDVAGAATGRPRVVCLCGSTRFYDEFQQANYDLTMRGEIVLSVGFYPHAKAQHGHGEGVGHDSSEKTALDELHKRKIDLADYVLVLNPGGYIGESTRSEVAYAYDHGKPVRYLILPPDIADPAEVDPNHEPGLAECGCRMCDPGRYEDDPFASDEDTQRRADLRAHVSGTGGTSPSWVTDNAAGVAGVDDFVQDRHVDLDVGEGGGAMTDADFYDRTARRADLDGDGA